MFVREQLKELEFSEKDKYQIVLAVDEACANAIIHGNKCDAVRQLSIEWVVSKVSLKIRIQDVGSFPQNIKPVIDIQKHIKLKQKGGLGLFIIHSIMDDVEFFNEQNHQICQLTKKINFSI